MSHWHLRISVFQSGTSNETNRILILVLIFSSIRGIIYVHLTQKCWHWFNLYFVGTVQIYVMQISTTDKHQTPEISNLIHCPCVQSTWYLILFAFSNLIKFLRLHFISELERDGADFVYFFQGNSMALIVLLLLKAYFQWKLTMRCNRRIQWRNKSRKYLKRITWPLGPPARSKKRKPTQQEINGRKQSLIIC